MNRDDLPSSTMTAGWGSKGRKWAAYSYAAPAEPDKLLNVFLETYWRGLRKPVHFFPSSSLVYAEQLHRHPDAPGNALRYAQNQWEGTPQHRGDCKDPYFDLCFRWVNPLNVEFTDLAKKLLHPMFDSESEVK